MKRDLTNRGPYATKEDKAIAKDCGVTVQRLRYDRAAEGIYFSPLPPAIPSGWRKLRSTERARQGDLAYDELLGAFRAKESVAGWLANNCTVIRKRQALRFVPTLRSPLVSNLPRWHFVARLSASERISPPWPNHKGYYLCAPSGSIVAEIYPGDGDGEAGKQMAELIVNALNRK